MTVLLEIWSWKRCSITSLHKWIKVRPFIDKIFMEYMGLHIFNWHIEVSMTERRYLSRVLSSWLKQKYQAFPFLSYVSTAVYMMWLYVRFCRSLDIYPGKVVLVSIATVQPCHMQMTGNIMTLKCFFYCWHIAPPHYHHRSDLFKGFEHIRFFIFIIWSVCLRWNLFSPLYNLQCLGLYVMSRPIYFWRQYLYVMLL